MEAILKAQGLSKRYTLSKDNYVDALRGADLEVRRGEMVAIMGPSGSGKSTLLHLLGCLDAPDSGTLELQGRRVDNLRNGQVNQIRRNELGLHLPGLQPGAHAERRRECGPGRRVCRPLAQGSDPQGGSGARGRRPARPRRPPAQRTLGRPAAAGGHRPGAGEPAGGHPGRRTHGQPGQRELGRRHRHDA